MEISFSPQCGTRRLREVNNTGWKWECLDCFETICILKMERGQNVLFLQDEVDDTMALELLDALCDDQGDNDKGVSP